MQKMIEDLSFVQLEEKTAPGTIGALSVGLGGYGEFSLVNEGGIDSLKITNTDGTGIVEISGGGSINGEPSYYYSGTEHFTFIDNGVEVSYAGEMPVIPAPIEFTMPKIPYYKYFDYSYFYSDCWYPAIESCYNYAPVEMPSYGYFPAFA